MAFSWKIFSALESHSLTSVSHSLKLCQQRILSLIRVSQATDASVTVANLLVQKRVIKFLYKKQNFCCSSQSILPKVKFNIKASYATAFCNNILEQHSNKKQYIKYVPNYFFSRGLNRHETVDVNHSLIGIDELWVIFYEKGK